MPEIEILPDADALAKRAADEFLRLADEAIRTRGRFAVALAGGSTPKRMYGLLTVAQLDWRGIHVFWGDERCVPPDHADSNYRMAAEALLNHVSIPPQNLHRIQGKLPAEKAASAYEDELRRTYVVRFDLILLGLGPDGHTASLFPGGPALHEATRRTAAVHHETPPPPLVDRVTLTPPAINAAANVIFLVSGGDKAEVLARVLQGPSQPDLLPAQAIRPADGRLLWLLDRSAAAGIAATTAPGS
jgi:6-phosphogluconolactonase